MLHHRLRHRVTFRRQVNAQDPETGIITREWQTATLADGTVLDQVPAEVLTGPGREWMGSGTINAETAARINVRWFPGLLQSWCVVWDGRIFNIESAETDITGRQEWRLRCVDGPSEGL